MSVLRIMATNKVAGELVLPTLGPSIALKSGDQTIVSEKQYWSDDIQRCISLGKIVVVEGEITKNEDYTTYMYVRSLRNSILVLPSIPKGLAKGSICKINQKQFNNTDVQQAIQRGYVEVVPESVVNARKVAEKELKAVSDPVEDGSLAALRSLQKKENDDIAVKAIKPEPKVSLEGLDESEVYKATGKARVTERSKPPTDYKPYDPRPQPPKVVEASRKGVIKRVGTSSGVAGGENPEDGVYIDVT